MSNSNGFGRESISYTTASYSPAGNAGAYPSHDLDEVRRRRVAAFIFDSIAIAVICSFAAIFVAFLGVITFSLGWMLFPLIFPVTALAYVGFTLGGEHQATPGMQMFDIHIIRRDGRPVDFWTAVVYAGIFWVTFFTVLVLLVSLFTPNKELLQDLLMGTVVVRD